MLSSRSVIIIAAGWAVIGSGLTTQRVYNRSTSLRSLRAMGFGETNINEMISWKQATEVVNTAV